MRRPTPLQGLAQLAERRPWAILAVTILLGILAALGASRLRLDPSLRALLPPEFPSLQRLEAAETRLGPQADLLVAIRSPSRDANLRFGEALAGALQERDDLRWVVFHRDPTYFEHRALLYADLGELLELRRRVIEQIREHVRREAYGDFSPTGGHADEPLSGLDQEVDTLRQRLRTDGRVRPYLEADEGRLMVLEARPKRPATDIAYATRLRAEVEALAGSLQPASFHPHMQVRVEGSYAQHSRRVTTLRDEVVQGSAFALVALVIAIVLYFRSARAVVLVITPPLLAATGALAFAWVAFGRLNLVSAFIFAVLLGLGIDFGIHVLARYRDERRRARDRHEALTVALGTTGRATAAGAASTALAFGVLMAADFRGFAQFGAVAAVGIVLALVAAVVVMPALLVALDRVRPWNPPAVRRGGAPSIPRVVVGVLSVGALLLGGATALWGARAMPGLPFEYDLEALGPVEARSEPSDSPRASYRDAVGHARTVDPAVALASSREQAQEIQRQLDALASMDAATVEHLAEHGTLPPQPVAAPQRPARDGGGEGFEDFEDFGADLEAFGDDDLEDPAFVELQTVARAHHLGSPAVVERLVAYGPDRLRTLHDRLDEAYSIHSFVPDLQREKLKVIADIRQRIEAKRETLSAKQREQLDRWIGYLQVDEPITVDTLPPWLRAQFADADGDVGRHVVVATRGSKADYRNARRIYDAFFELQTSSGPVAVAAEFFVIPEIVDAIANDGPVVLVLSMVVLLVTSAIVFRTLAGPVAVALTVGVALSWLAAGMAVLDAKVNLFNIIALPLLVGMGQDDAIHLLSRWRERSGPDLRRALRETSGAILLTTVTTCCGFGGILFANHRGLLSLGWMAVSGMAACWLASVVMLPAALVVTGWLRCTRAPR